MTAPIWQWSAVDTAGAIREGRATSEGSVTSRAVCNASRGLIF